MKYIDLHCDTLTECLDKGYSLSDCNLHTNLTKLKKALCAAQCFAIFTDGANSRQDFFNYLDFYKTSAQKNGLLAFDGHISPDQCPTRAILTVENIGFTGGDVAQIRRLKSYGVAMASLVWNNENALAYPNLVMRGGVPDFAASEGRGLKPAGRRAVEIFDEEKIILDVSHLSDGGTDEVLRGRKTPTVASHSNAREVCAVSRNLTDGQIRAIAHTGGAIGVNFCKDFLGEGDVFGLVLAHVKHIINVGGEDVVAFGSDFDGIPTVAGLEGCEKMPALIEYLSRHFPARVIEKLCYQNAARVFEEVCG